MSLFVNESDIVVDDLDNSSEFDSIFSDDFSEDIEDTSGVTDVTEDGIEDSNQPEDSDVSGSEPQKLWAGRFKSPEEMEQAFLSMSKQDDKAVFDELVKLRQQSMVKNQQQQEDGNSQQLQELMNSDPQKALNVMIQQAVQQALKHYVVPMQTRLESLNMQTELNKLKATKPDFSQVAPYLAKVFAENPELWNVKNPITTAYALAKAEYADKAVSLAKEEGRKEAYESKARKTRAVAEGQKAKVQKKENSEEEELLDAIFNTGTKGGNIFF